MKRPAARAPRPAVAVQLTRERDVLLVRRSPELRAFPGMWAFPGGKVAAADREAPVEGIRDAGEAARLAAAVREVFEETGVFLARAARPLGTDARRALRKELLAGAIGTAELLARAEARIHAADFAAVADRMTPGWAPFRFATRFYRCRTPAGEVPEVWPGEIVETASLTPAAALRRWLNGRMPLAPPVIGLLERWSWDDREYEGRNREAGLPEPGVLPLTRASPGVAIIACRTPTLPPATHTNAVFIGEEHCFLVDPAPVDPGERAGLFARVDRLLAERGGNLAAVLVTHHHPDHTGSVLQAARRYGAPVAAHPETLARMPPVPGAVLRLEGGESFPLGASPDGKPGWRLAVRFLPGHAPGHLAFVENRYGTILAGDMVSSLSSVLIPPEDGDLGQYMESLRELAGECEGAVVPGHGPPVVEGRRLLEGQLRHREAREEKLLKALGAAPLGLRELGVEVYPATEVPASGPVRDLALASLTSGLRKLEREGRAVHDGGRWSRPPS